MTKVQPGKTRKIKPTTEALEDRNLLTALPLHGSGPSEMHALLKPAIQMATRPNAESATHGSVRDNTVKIAHHSVTTGSEECRPRRAYDVAIHFAYVGSPGNASVAINGFVPPSRATVPAQSASSGGTYQNIGGVPYVYAIGQTEIILLSLFLGRVFGIGRF
jgi:hypothetical protein